MAKYLGRGVCEGDDCGKPVEVYADRNGLAYYKCGPCQRKVMHGSQTRSAKFVSKIDRHAEEEGAPAKLQAPAKAAAVSPDLPMPDRAPPPAAPAPAGKSFFGFGS